MDEIIIDYNGTAIHFDDSAGEWYINEHAQEALGVTIKNNTDINSVKRAIDRSVDVFEEKKVPFRRFEAYRTHYIGRWERTRGLQKVTVTSIDNSNWRTKARITLSEGKRETETRLFAVNDSNTAKFQKVQALRKQSSELSDRALGIEWSMKAIDIEAAVKANGLPEVQGD